MWTPDAKTIYFGSNGKESMHVYAKAADEAAGNRSFWKKMLLTGLRTCRSSVDLASASA